MPIDEVYGMNFFRVGVDRETVNMGPNQPI
jgi:hypothetical protein